MSIKLPTIVAVVVAAFAEANSSAAVAGVAIFDHERRREETDLASVMHTQSSTFAWQQNELGKTVGE